MTNFDITTLTDILMSLDKSTTAPIQHIVHSWNSWYFIRRMTNFDITALTYILMSLDKSSHASCKTQKFADVFEKGADFSKLLKSQGTSLKTIDTLDTCTRTALMSGFLSRGNPQMAEEEKKKKKKEEENQPNRLSHGKVFFCQSLPPRLSPYIDLSRATSHARHVTHDTSRTTRHARQRQR